MALIVKIMNDPQHAASDRPTAGYRILADILEVGFREATFGDAARIDLVYKRETEMAPEIVTTIYPQGNVYVMNEAGKTISSFVVPGPSSFTMGPGDPRP